MSAADATALAHVRAAAEFETRISNGRLTAYPGAERDRWERALYGGAYRGAHPSQRPRYGGLPLMRNLNGACPGFGSCHLRLRPRAPAGRARHRVPARRGEHRAGRRQRGARAGAPARPGHAARGAAAPEVPVAHGGRPRPAHMIGP